MHATLGNGRHPVVLCSEPHSQTPKTRSSKNELWMYYSDESREQILIGYQSFNSSAFFPRRPWWVIYVICSLFNRVPWVRPYMFHGLKMNRLRIKLQLSHNTRRRSSASSGGGGARGWEPRRPLPPLPLSMTPHNTHVCVCVCVLWWRQPTHCYSQREPIRRAVRTAVLSCSIQKTNAVLLLIRALPFSDFFPCLLHTHLLHVPLHTGVGPKSI